MNIRYIWFCVFEYNFFVFSLVSVLNQPFICLTFLLLYFNIVGNFQTISFSSTSGSSSPRRSASMDSLVDQSQAAGHSSPGASLLGVPLPSGVTPSSPTSLNPPVMFAMFKNAANGSLKQHGGPPASPSPSKRGVRVAGGERTSGFSGQGE